MASRLFKTYDIPHRPDSKAVRAPKRPERAKGLETAANLAFFGGRQEARLIGHISGPIYGYDLNSAYAHGLLSAPCPYHTRWELRRGPPVLPGEPGFSEWAGSPHWLANVVFSHPRRSPWCGIPIPF